LQYPLKVLGVNCAKDHTHRTSTSSHSINFSYLYFHEGVPETPLAILDNQNNDDLHRR
jgi:hypothetical protein